MGAISRVFKGATKAVKKVTKGVTKAAKKIGKGIAKIGKSVWNGVKKLGGKAFEMYGKISGKLGPIGMIGLSMAMPCLMPGFTGTAGGLWTKFGAKMGVQATAGQNSVNQANAMNAFNLSNQGLSFLWQEMRDAAKWEYEAAQNSEDRASVLAQAALGNEAASDAVKSNNLKTLGQWALDIWKNI